MTPDEKKNNSLKKTYATVKKMANAINRKEANYSIKSVNNIGLGRLFLFRWLFLQKFTSATYF